jgi:hypothetical protein
MVSRPIVEAVLRESGSGAEQAKQEDWRDAAP